MVACMMFNPDGELDENYEQMCEAINGIKTGQVTFAIKDTNINNIQHKTYLQRVYLNTRVLITQIDRPSAADANFR